MFVCENVSGYWDVMRVLHGAVGRGCWGRRSSGVRNNNSDAGVDISMNIIRRIWVSSMIDVAGNLIS